MNTAIKIIEEIIKEVEQYNNGDDNLKKAIQEGMISGLNLAHKRISSLPSFDIDSLQRYDISYSEYYTGMNKSDDGEYICYDDLKKLLQDTLELKQ